MNLKKYCSLIGISTLFFVACTDLQEEVLDGVELEEAAASYAVSGEDPATLLNGAYVSLASPFQGTGALMALDEHTADGVVAPTRGGDWDANGQWRKLHSHTWGVTHPTILSVYRSLYNGVNAANLVIGSSQANPQQVAEARFVRALCYYKIIDLWGQAAYREIGSDTNADALVYERPEATDFVIAELEAVLDQLPADADPARANQNVAHWLLAKLYLNYGVFARDAQNPTFDNADMDKVVAHVDQIIDRAIATNYWDNFSPDNAETSAELLFVSQNFGGNRSSGVNNFWFASAHYNQTPSGWNGFTTLAEYYELFDPADERINATLPAVTENSGYNVGFQIGQQYGPGGPEVGEKLQDRLGNDLVFTKETSLITKGRTLESAGIRGLKYVPDYANLDLPGNDHVIARYADALLMKAEALARKGDLAQAQTVVQSLPHERTTTITAVDDIYVVRARELWWEGWRRNDMIRFGKYLQERELKPYESDVRFLLFPIPLAATSNPNITQNPGY